jgi:hypothetical protein
MLGICESKSIGSIALDIAHIRALRTRYPLIFSPNTGCFKVNLAKA